MKNYNLKERLKMLNIDLYLNKDYFAFRYYLLKNEIDYKNLNDLEFSKCFYDFLDKRKTYIKGLRDYKFYIDTLQYNQLITHLREIKERLEIKNQGHYLNMIYEIRAYARKRGDENSIRIVNDIFKVPEDATYIRKLTGLNRMSSFKKLPYSKDEYLLLIQFLINNKSLHYIFLGIFLSTGLRPIDIETGSFIVEYNNQLLIEEIAKTKDKDFKILSVLDANLLKNKIIFIQNKLYSAPRGKSLHFKIILDLLGLNTLYDVRALYSCTLYFFFKDNFKIEKKYKENLNNFIARSLCHSVLSPHNQNYYVYTGEYEEGRVSSFLKMQTFK